eukprot:gene25773-32264_t
MKAAAAKQNLRTLMLYEVTDPLTGRLLPEFRPPAESLSNADSGEDPQKTFEMMYAKGDVVVKDSVLGCCNEPESGKADAGREYALTQTINAAKKCKAAGSLPILIGDFNCAPDTSALNYQQIVNAGYRDTYIEAEQNKVLSANCHTYTWDPENVLNKGGVHGHCPPQRVDHVFLPQGEATFGKVTHCDVVFSEKIVTLPSGQLCSLSDHYGVVVEVDTTVNPSVGGVVTPIGRV